MLPVNFLVWLGCLGFGVLGFWVWVFGGLRFDCDVFGCLLCCGVGLVGCLVVDFSCGVSVSWCFVGVVACRFAYCVLQCAVNSVGLFLCYLILFV